MSPAMLAQLSGDGRINTDPNASSATPSPSFTDDDKSLTQLLLDREERAVAALLTRFKNLVTLAATPAGDGATKEVAASQSFQMEVETNALIGAAEDLLKLTRELKEMWLFGPLRDIGEGESEGTIDEDAKKVGEIVEKLLEKSAQAPAT
ncbi:hypothetical protein BP6252_12779 [Coleophoma cylindrospora]|uniref:Mediator of RNA polymerase II transcription subunit 22 n=1 Tax=Coleophoma cylindrospora TaxID=1849047 RepID=A0A3D8QCV2_9HELO|nr:hypothetical protein BP6252_12779 [Coleophoma cylindrospora]